MPFTPSHVVFVLPFGMGRLGRRIAPAALAIGSMVPDLPYFVPRSVQPHRTPIWTHAAYGPFTIDLLLGLAVWAGWRWLLQRPLTELAPVWIARRVPVFHPLRRWDAVAVPGSVILGAITHVFVDAFTHPDRWGTRNISALDAPIGGLPVYKWLQYGLGGLGLAIVILWCADWLRRAAARPYAPRIPPVGRWLSWWAVGGVALGAVAGLLAGQLAAGAALEIGAYRLVTGSIGLTGGAVLLCCAFWTWWLSTRPARPAEVQRIDAEVVVGDPEPG